MDDEKTAERIATLIVATQGLGRDLVQDTDPEVDAQIARGLAELHEKRSVKKIMRIWRDE